MKKVLLTALLATLSAASAATLVFGGNGEPVSLESGNITDGISILVQRQIYDTLVDFEDGTTDLKPGDIVQHPERGPGLVGGGKQILYLARDGFVYAAVDPDGWERVETCTTEAVRILEDYQQIASKSAGVVVRDAVVMMTPAVYEAHHGRETVRPGHVQVRIDDLELGPSVYETEGEFVSSVMRDFPEYSEGDLRLIYRALVAQRVEHLLDLLELRAVLGLPLRDELLRVGAVPGLVGRLDLGVDVGDHGAEVLGEVLPLRQLTLDDVEVHSEPTHCVLLL